MRTRAAPVAALLFGSGFCALVYQIGWLRELRLIFGASTAASAAVLAIFIGGLGAGGLLLGARADRHPRPLGLYATLEAAIAVSAALTPLLLAAVRAIYIASGGSARLGTAAATIERLALSAIVLAAPTLAMGGTLPAAGCAVTRDADTRRRDLAALYAANALGAVAGCLAATFFLLEIAGTRATLWIASATSALIAVAARAIATPQPGLPGPPGLPGLPGLPGHASPAGWAPDRAALAAGSSRRTSVPSPGLERTVRVPPADADLSRIEARPRPGGASAANPLPWSATSRMTRRLRTDKVTQIVAAPEWRSALCRASWATR
jgi:spermidine synthase